MRDDAKTVRLFSASRSTYMKVLRRGGWRLADLLSLTCACEQQTFRAEHYSCNTISTNSNPRDVNIIEGHDNIIMAIRITQ